MCGIAGILAPRPQDQRLVRKAMRAMAHRGPDGEGILDDGPCLLGHMRLAILDLSDRAAQPMALAQGRLRIVFNGEIYNYLELRRTLEEAGVRFATTSDTEVLLAAYAHWGPGCLSRLRGMFAFAVWDREARTLFLARDRTGEKPLYYAFSDGRFLFASEMKALLAMLPGTPVLDPAAVDAFLHYQYVPEPDTPLAGVRKLPAAHCMTLTPGGPQPAPVPYWRLEDAAPVHGDPAALIRDELHRVIDLTLRSDVPVGLALSGGLDSGALAALAAPRYKDTLHTFCVGYPGRPPYDERDRAEALASRLGLPFHAVELRTEDMRACFRDLVRIMDDPIADIAAFGHYSVMRLAADHGIKVMLTGLGGDELFWGYPWVARSVHLTRRKLRWLGAPRWMQALWPGLRKAADALPLRRAARSARVPTALRGVLGAMADVALLDLDRPDHAVFYDLAPDFAEAMATAPGLYPPDFARKVGRNNAHAPFLMDASARDCVPLAVCGYLFRTWLASNCLALGDRVSMACSVEARVPLLDHGLIELVMGLRLGHGDYVRDGKGWLKAALADVLPQDILDRPKQGFQPPSTAWMRAVLEDHLPALRSGHLAAQGVLDTAALDNLVAGWKDGGRHPFMLFKLVVLETWYNTVVCAREA